MRHPLRFAKKLLWPFGWSRRTVLLLVMQTLDNAIAFRAKKGWFGGVGLSTEQDPAKPNPTFIPVANEAAEWLAKHTGGVAQSGLFESLANIPTTAHILGGAVIGRDAASGVVDRHNRVFGYQQPARLRRRRDAGQSGGEPVADDHRHRRTCDEPHPAGRARWRR